MPSPTNEVLVVQEPAGCYMCGITEEYRYQVFVESIEQDSGSGWRLRGSGRVRSHCMMCSAMYEAVQNRIPIECESYACPKCHQSQTLEYKVNKIDARGTEFSFEAEIRCEKCQTKRTIVQVLKDLMKLKKLEIKLTGISIER